jgi:hypothetical protein
MKYILSRQIGKLGLPPEPKEGHQLIMIVIQKDLADCFDGLQVLVLRLGVSGMKRVLQMRGFVALSHIDSDNQG